MPVRVWRSIHLLAYGLLALTSVHALAAGTDTAALVPTALGVVLGCVIVFACGIAWGVRRDGNGLPRLPRITVAPPKSRVRPMAPVADRR
jgi:DMSO/TMAO reductase YedYZ heme-binding membrane subunit